MEICEQMMIPLDRWHKSVPLGRTGFESRSRPDLSGYHDPIVPPFVKWVQTYVRDKQETSKQEKWRKGLK
jgi:hypothetical protein